MKMLKLMNEDEEFRAEEVMKYDGDWVRYNDTVTKEVTKEINICSATYDYFIGEDSYGEHTLYRNKKKNGESE